jgi:hypothetical protein
VHAQLLGERPGALSVVAPGHGLVLLWGRMFQLGDQLFIQSFVQFERRGISERLTLNLGGQKLAAALSAQAFAGFHRQMAASDFHQIEAFSRTARRIFYEPADNSGSTLLPADRPVSYYVSEVRGEWLRIHSFWEPGFPDLQGWIKATSAGPKWTLREFLPEEAFVEGVAGYLSFRVKLERGAPDSDLALTVGDAGTSLDEYQEKLTRGSILAEGRDPAAGNSLAMAIPRQLRGVMLGLKPRATTDDMREAKAQFGAAARLAASSAEARNLYVTAALALSYQGADSGISGEDAVKELLDALALEPDDRLALANLACTYELLLLPDDRQPRTWSPLSQTKREEARRQLKAIDAILSSQ